MSTATTNQMAMFTLAQKVYTVRMYYRRHENTRGALESLQTRYGIVCNEENLATVTRIIRTFESTGTVLNRFYYNLHRGPGANSPLKPVKETNKSAPTFLPPPRASVKDERNQESQIQIVEMQDDDLIVEVLSEFDQEATLKEEDGTADIHEVEVGDEDVDDHIQMDELEEEDDDGENDDGEDEDGEEEEEEGEEDEEAYIIAAAADAEAYEEEVVTVRTAGPRALIPSRHVRQVHYSLCTECGESVPNPMFRRHMAMHRDPQGNKGAPRDYPCDMCDQVFKSRSSHFTHRRKHFPHLQFVCEVCAKVSTSKATHKNHMLIHSDEKPHACTHCPMTFRRLQGLRRHSMTHTGEKPLTCTVCGAGFLAHMTLKMHMRLHTGERPYACEHCDQRFIGRPSLNTHLKKNHREEYLYECPVCRGRFKTDATRATHMGKKHRISLEPEIKSE